MSLLEVKNIYHTFGDKPLFKDASLSLFGGDKMGLTGLNGAGKTTFIQMLTGHLLPDQGTIKWNQKLRVSYLDQQAGVKETISVHSYLESAFSDLFEMEKCLEKINEEIAQTQDENRLYKLYLRMGGLQEELESRNFYAIHSEVEKIAHGLSIHTFGMDTPLCNLSGGQRIRVLLGKMLLERPDVLILDEPTNFLDKENVEWLAKYLISFQGAFILVSHDLDFLNRVVNCICDIDQGKITRFNGNYESFLVQKEKKQAEYAKQYQAQQKEIANLEDYISRNIVRASTSKMAKSRQKRLDKIERLEKPTDTAPPSFSFSYTPPVGKTVLWINDLEVGYDQPLLPPMNLMLRAGQKIAVTGFNGIGKTTFLKTICGFLPPVHGSFRMADRLKIGYFEQEHIWSDPSLTPLQEVKNCFPKLNDKEVRAALARSGLKSTLMMQKLSTLSGGEQAKVKICKLTLESFGLLVLDEPTNHLDRLAIERLKTAILEFEGTVIFVSHSKEFCDEVADATFNFESLFD